MGEVTQCSPSLYFVGSLGFGKYKNSRILKVDFQYAERTPFTYSTAPHTHQILSQTFSMNKNMHTICSGNVQTFCPLTFDNRNITRKDSQSTNIRQGHATIYFYRSWSCRLAPPRLLYRIPLYGIYCVRLKTVVPFCLHPVVDFVLQWHGKTACDLIFKVHATTLRCVYLKS